jgi:CRISPR/Cas system-associated exonuclease Cas4 (RecB family)
MKWSYSAMKEYLTCPKMYEEFRVLKNYVRKDTEHTIYGKEIHQALEDYVSKNIPLKHNYRQFKKFVDPILEIPGTKYTEFMMALNENKQICEYGSPDAWVRGIADLVIIDESLGWCVDYKTGKDKYADTKQLMLMALMIFAYFPKVNTVKAGLLFLNFNNFIPVKYTRDKIDKYWDKFHMDLQRMEQSHRTGIFPKKPGGLCAKWCQVLTCEFNQRSVY